MKYLAYPGLRVKRRMVRMEKLKPMPRNLRQQATQGGRDQRRVTGLLSLAHELDRLPHVALRFAVRPGEADRYISVLFTEPAPSSP